VISAGSVLMRASRDLSIAASWPQSGHGEAPGGEVPEAQV
jgi:hypothetical protein